MNYSTKYPNGEFWRVETIADLRHVLDTLTELPGTARIYVDPPGGLQSFAFVTYAEDGPNDPQFVVLHADD
jgi:hypothetical protein